MPNHSFLPTSVIIEVDTGKWMLKCLYSPVEEADPICQRAHVWRCSVPLHPSFPPDQTPTLTDTCYASRTTGAEKLPSECSALVGGALNQELDVFRYFCTSIRKYSF